MTGNAAPLPPPIEPGNQQDVTPGAGGQQHKEAPTRLVEWASLPEDLVHLVATRLLAGGDLLDYFRFRAVCTSWWSGTASLGGRGRGVVNPRRWMMLPEGHGLYPGHPDLLGHVRFLNLDTGALVRAHLPLFGDHVAIDSVDGLLVLVRDSDSAVRLLHPFTGDVAEFPPLATVLPQLDFELLPDHPVPHKIKNLTRIVGASVSVGDGAITLMLGLHHLGCVAFATSMDRQWTLSSWSYSGTSFAPLSYQGKMYVLDTDVLRENAMVFQIDPPVKDAVGSGCALNPPNLIATLPLRNLVRPVHLVECDSEILVVVHKGSYMSQIAVFKLADLLLQRHSPITSIGGNTLFLSERSVSVASKALASPMGDCVVYPHPRHENLMQYHLSTGTWSLATDDCSVYDSAPGPCSLVHHIYSCCIRNRWNRGLIFGEHLQPRCAE